jgi:hypothetical protein
MKTAPILVPGVRIQGATYIGICTAADGSLYALLRLSSDPDSRRSFSEQLAWAKGLNADLATKPEAALICALKKPESGWYWTKDEYDASSAWLFFSFGSTLSYRKSAAGGALSVRRIPIQSFNSLLQLAASIEAAA